MSGPKRGRISIVESMRREIAAERRREAERRRNEYLERVARRKAIAREKAERRVQKEEDLRENIKECRSRLKALVQEYGAEAVDATRVEGWIASAEAKLKGDLREGWREVNGVESFLDRKESALRGRFLQRNQEEAYSGPSEAELFLSEVEDVLSDYPAVSSPGIAQRLDLLRGAVKVNRENPNTLEQVKSLLAKVNELVEAYEIRKKEREFAIKVFAEAIGAEPPGPDTGQTSMAEGKLQEIASRQGKGTAAGDFTPTSFSGSIAGMPITVTFENEETLLLNTPEHGDCKTPLKELRNKLAEKGIELGSVRITKTGENWNPVSTDHVRNRARA